MKFQFLDEHRDKYNVKPMAEILGVSPSGYYEWRRRSNSPRHRHRLELARAIENIPACEAPTVARASSSSSRRWASRPAVLPSSG
jgi:hypothetical protein